MKRIPSHHGCNGSFRKHYEVIETQLIPFSKRSRYPRIGYSLVCKLSQTSSQTAILAELEKVETHPSEIYQMTPATNSLNAATAMSPVSSFEDKR
jgi:hypothetical protein